MIDPNQTPAKPRSERERGPKSAVARYAFGYSDEKPGWKFWLIHAGMIAFILSQTIHIS